jgi:beta-glucosidase
MLTTFAALAMLQSGSVNQDPATEARISAVLAQMTLEEKIDVIAGVDGFYVREMPKAGLPRLKMSDGPVGVRNDGPTTAYPAGFTLAATWNPDLANQFGTGIGRDARARGVHIWLGPGVNLSRVVQNGRNFEYLGEDPLLAGRIATEIVKGVQSQGVSATVKHFAGNEHENDRNNDDSIVDERTLRELYLKPFEMVVKDGKVGAVMTSYNLLNGVHASASKYLMDDVLKGEWGFKGLVMSDWGGVHETDGPFLNGLDLEMPDPHHFNRTTLLGRLQSGALPTATLDDKVRRILRVAYAMNWDKRPQKDPSILLDDPQNAAAAIEVAREGAVLLKNKGNVLPLNKPSQKILVVGPNADPAVTGGGGSAYTTPNRSVSVRQALERLAPAGTQVSYLPGYASMDRAFQETKFDDGLKAETFNNRNLEGEPTRVRTVQSINMSNSSRTNFSTRWTGQFTAKESGEHLLVMQCDDGMRVFIDGEKVFDEWHDQASTIYTKPIMLTAGKPVKVVVEYYQGGGDAVAKFGIVKSLSNSLEKELPADAVSGADAVVACVGFKGNGQPYEGEGSDRPWELPAEQVAMLRRLVSLNKRVIVVLNAGAGVATKPWIDGAAGFIQAGYPGGEGNLALAEILYGKTSPSGKLPTSFPAEIQGTYYASAYPSVNRKMVYREGPFIGYRWFDANKATPLYPFGFGLSYSTFALSKPSVENGEQIRVSVELKNTGKMSAAETVQVYAEPPKGQAPRAPRELRAFKRVSLAPGQSQRVSMSFDRKDLAWYDAQGKRWVVDPGTYRLRIGTSSRSLPLTVAVKVP